MLSKKKFYTSFFLIICFVSAFLILEKNSNQNKEIKYFNRILFKQKNYFDIYQIIFSNLKDQQILYQHENTPDIKINLSRNLHNEFERAFFHLLVDNYNLEKFFKTTFFKKTDFYKNIVENKLKPQDLIDKQILGINISYKKLFLLSWQNDLEILEKYVKFTINNSIDKILLNIQFKTFPEINSKIDYEKKVKLRQVILYSQTNFSYNLENYFYLDRIKSLVDIEFDIIQRKEFFIVFEHNYFKSLYHSLVFTLIVYFMINYKKFLKLKLINLTKRS